MDTILYSNDSEEITRVGIIDQLDATKCAIKGSSDLLRALSIVAEEYEDALWLLSEELHDQAHNLSQIEKAFESGLKNANSHHCADLPTNI